MKKTDMQSASKVAKRTSKGGEKIGSAPQPLTPSVKGANADTTAPRSSTRNKQPPRGSIAASPDGKGSGGRVTKTKGPTSEKRTKEKDKTPMPPVPENQDSDDDGDDDDDDDEEEDEDEDGEKPKRGRGRPKTAKSAKKQTPVKGELKLVQQLAFCLAYNNLSEQGQMTAENKHSLILRYFLGAVKLLKDGGRDEGGKPTKYRPVLEGLPEYSEADLKTKTITTGEEWPGDKIEFHAKDCRKKVNKLLALLLRSDLLADKDGSPQPTSGHDWKAALWA